MKKYIKASSIYDYPVEDVVYQWSKEDLWKLRQEIVLDSLFTREYENSFGVIPRRCQDFFDGYSEELEYILETDETLPDYNDAQFYDYLDSVDTPDNLYDYYYYTIEYPMLNPIEKMIELYCPKIGLDYDGSMIISQANSYVEMYIGEYVGDNSYDDWKDLVKSLRSAGDRTASGDFGYALDDDYELGEDYTEAEAKEFGEALKKLADYIEAIIG